MHVYAIITYRSGRLLNKRVGNANNDLITLGLT